MSRLVVWGAGELGGRVARRWLESGDPVLGLTKTIERHEALRALGVEPQTGSAVGRLQPEDRLLLAIPGHTNQGEAIEALQAAGTPAPARAVLISVTGYHGLASGVISAETPVGESKRAASIAATEQRFRDWAGAQGVILRLGGLYCAGRGPFAALARRGQVSRQRPPNKTMALIHYDDAAAAAHAALRHPAPAPVYLAVTPPCPTRAEFYNLACARLGLPEPEYEPPLDAPPAQYDVTHLRRDLLPAPAYPDWRMALSLE